jgi:hypothetical protein
MLAGNRTNSFKRKKFSTKKKKANKGRGGEGGRNKRRKRVGSYVLNIL